MIREPWNHASTERSQAADYVAALIEVNEQTQANAELVEQVRNEIRAMREANDARKS